MKKSAHRGRRLILIRREVVFGVFPEYQWWIRGDVLDKFSNDVSPRVLSGYESLAKCEQPNGILPAIVI